MKKMNIIFLVVGICVGLLIGCSVMWFLQLKDSQLAPEMYRRFQEKDRATSVLTDIVNPWSVLVLLRNDKIPMAINVLEQRLSIGLFVLADYKGKHNVEYGNLMKKIAEYRKKNPWKSKLPKLNEKVDAFLAEKSGK